MSQSNLYPSLPGDDLRSQTQVDSPRVLVHEYNGNFNQAEERKTSDSTNINSSLITTAVATTTTTTTIAAAAATTTTATAIAAPSATASRAVTTTTTTLNPTMTLSTNPPIPLSTYISLSQVAISSALKVAMVSTSMSLGVARTIVSGLDTVLGYAVKGVVGQNDEGSRGLSPAFIASLPFRAALLGINFSDILVQTILETVDGSVNLALTTVQDGLDLMDTLFGPDSTSQTGETFREVWAILNREFIQSGDGEGGAGGYPALEGMRLLMAYVAIQFATSEQWETIRVRTQGRLIGECLESKDEELGSSTAWSALAAWPEEWTKGHRGLTTEERLQEERILELREQREGRTAASFSAYAPGTPSMRSGSPNPELTNFLAASYRFSRFCSAMYGSTALEFMGAPERYPPPPIPVSTAPSAPPAPASLHTTPSASPLATELPRTTSTSDHHFHCYTGTPLGSILYSSDTAATIQDGYYSPRYYLLDDVESKQIVLVLRGTKSLHDLMIDLTCDAADLWLDHDTTPLVDSQGNIVDREAQQQRRKRPFKVHGGFLKAARTIASADTIGIQEKVKAALESRPDYSLLLVGHSLGAGIASILSMLWADPATGFTPEVPSHSSATATTAPHVGLGLASGLGLGVEVDDARGRLYLPGYLPQNNAESFLPPGRRVRCYAYGIPKVMCPRMSKRAIKLVTSLSYGDDVVGRLSLGSVRNIGHAMRALLAMRPPPPPSPPATPSPPSSPRMGATSTEIEVLHDSSETLEELLEDEGEHIDRARQEREEAKERERQRKRKEKKSAQMSIGLEIVQKVIRWNLTKEEKLLEEFMDIRRAMQREMLKHQETYADAGDFFGEDETEASIDLSKISPVLVPPGKVLWIRPTLLEKELENAETKQHPINNIIHQFEWDHPIERDPASLLVPKPISQHLHRHLEEDESDNASIRSIKSTVRSGLYSTSPSSSPSSPPRASHTTGGHLHPPLQRQHSSDSVRTFQTTTTTSPGSLHPDSQNTDKLLYRMYAVPEPEHVFDEMLFSRRMWSDHLPLTYEFILAGKHAIPVTSPEAQKEKEEIVAASARGSVAV